ncbi:serine protease [Salininema proteolyticum]|uniref:Serine protease n=1 Tax=Salininema proteolyticum TaxID=1607685 RepID=A0ABV8TX93_9ACTN
MHKLKKVIATAAASAVGALALASGASAGEIGAKVVGGDPSQQDQFPYLVSLYRVAEDSHWCGGSLVADDIVLTASHCTEGADVDTYTVRHGSVELDSPDMAEYEVVDIFMPDNYGDETPISNDWALMKLAEPVPDAQTVALPQGTEVDEGPTYAVAGWGLTEDNVYPNEQRWAEVPYVNDTDCGRSYKRSSWWYADSMICAGYLKQGGVDACSADSGGPLVAREGDQDVLAGIVSWGNGCGKKRYPGVYAQVSWFLDDVNAAIAAMS